MALKPRLRLLALTGLVALAVYGAALLIAGLGLLFATLAICC